MSGAEFLAVIGGISAILSIADAIADIYKTIKDIDGLPEAFSVVNGRLPIVKNILKSAQQHIDAARDEAVCKGIKHIVEQCKTNADTLKDIFEKIKPDTGAGKIERYWKAVKAKGKGYEVEALMTSILVDIQLLNSQHGMNTATEDQQKEILAAIKKLSEVQLSISNSEFHHTGVTMNQSGSGERQYTAEKNVYSSGGSKQFKTERQHFVNENGEIDEDRFMCALFLSDPRDDREELVVMKGLRVEGTCEWIKSNALYDSWLHSHSQLLWLSGGPGKGKTMLSVFLAEELERTTNDSLNTLFLQYFCDNKDDKRNTGIAIVKGLIWQLLRKQRELFIHILPSLKDRDQSQLTTSFETLWRILETMLRDPILGNVYCILDGLDECEEVSLEVLLNKFKALFSPENNLSHCLKMIVVSRDLPEFIPRLLVNVPRIRLDPDADIEINNDIHQFIEARVGELSEHGQYNELLCLHVKTIFQDRAQGTFLWVALVAKALKKYKASEIKKEIDKFPPGLDELYARMLLQIDVNRRAFVVKVLLWVALAVRPLTLCELGTALEIDTKLSDDFSFDQVVRDQISYCGSFLTIVADEVRLVHQSAKDYLLRENPDSNPELEVFRVQEEAGNLEITRKCLAYLQDGALAKGMVDLSKDTVHLRAFPLISYAVLHWPEHARVLVYPGGIFDLSHPFFHKRSQIRESWLKTYWAEPKFKKPPYSFTLLHLASYLGIRLLAEVLVQKQGFKRKVLYSYNMNERDGYGMSALMWAARRGREAVVRLLLEKGANIEAKNTDGDTALIQVAKKGNKIIIQLLLEKRANIEAKDIDGNTALILAVCYRYETIVQLLLEKGANIEAKNKNGDTALIRAICEGHETIVQLLLEKGANIEAKNKNGNTALIQAAFKEYKTIVQLLLEKGANIEAKNSEGDTALIQVAKKGNKTIVQLLLEKGANIEAKDNEGETTLIQATCYRKKTIVQLLLEKGANIEAKDNKGETALIQAACYEHETIVQLLLEKGANIEAKDSKGNTALIRAAVEGHETTIRLLLEKGANIEAKDDFNRTALTRAVEKKHDFNRTALAYVVENKHETVIQLLLEKGASANMEAELPPEIRKKRGKVIGLLTWF